MKKQLLLILCSFFIAGAAYSQIPLFYGMTSTGGTANKGTIFKMNGDGTGFVTVYNFTAAGGNSPEGDLLKVPGSNFVYGMTKNGGASNLGVIFKFNLATNLFTTMLTFTGANGSHPGGNLFLAPNGLLYGMTGEGGTNGLGVLFSINPTNNAYVKILDFNGANGANPYHNSLIRGNNGSLYGMTFNGGSANFGVIFSLNITNNAFAKLHDFGTNSLVCEPAHPAGNLSETISNFYGTCTANNQGCGEGASFYFERSTNTLTVNHTFDVAANGQNPQGTLGYGGKSLGMTAYGGTGYGAIFSIVPFVHQLDFDGVTRGANPHGSLILASDNYLYGMAFNGGASGNGTAFKYNATANTFTKIHDFNGTNGSHPYADLTQVTCTAAPATPATISVNLTGAVCPGNVRTYSIAAVPGATNYIWTLPVGATGSSTGTAITVTYTAAFIANGTLTVKASNDCGTSAARSLAIARNTPATPGVISGAAKVCPGTVVTYSVTPVSGMGYTWATFTGAAITGVGGSFVTVTYNSGFTAASGIITVKASNGCGLSAARSLTISKNMPAVPGVITPNITGPVCSGTTRVYTVAPVSGMQYSWSLTPSGILSGSAVGPPPFNQLSATFSSSVAASNTLTVKAANGCGTSAARSLTIVGGVPAIPGPITGSTSVCRSTNHTYSIAAVANATDYFWSGSFMTVVSGQGTRTAVLASTSNLVNGSVRVIAHNACGYSTAFRSLNVNTNCREADPGMTTEPEVISAEVFPNPTHGNLTVQFSSLAAGNYSIRVMDMTGRLMRAVENEAEAGINVHEVDLSDLAKGLYIVMLQTGEETKKFKVMIE